MMQVFCNFSYHFCESDSKLTPPSPTLKLICCGFLLCRTAFMTSKIKDRIRILSFFRDQNFLHCSICVPFCRQLCEIISEEAFTIFTSGFLWMIYEEKNHCSKSGTPRQIWARQGPIFYPKFFLTGCFL